ncbi:MAG: ABC transporter ATP-binding protein [Pseudomonadota bacterium]
MLVTVKKLYALLDPYYRSRFVLILLLMVITAFFQAVGVAAVMPFLSVLADPEMIERVSTLAFLFDAFDFESRRSFLYFLGVAAFIVFTIGTALAAMSQWVVTRFSQMQQYQLSRRLMGDYLRRPYTFFLQRNSNDLAKTVLQESGLAVSGALLPAMRLIGFILLTLSIIALLVIVNPVLALSVACAISLSYAAVYFLSRSWLTRIGKDRIDANRKRFTAAAEAFAGAKEIRLLGREAQYLERYREPSHRIARHQANSALLKGLPQYAMEALAFGGVLLVCLYLMSDEAGIGSALPLIGLYGLAGKQLIPAVNKIFSSFADIKFNMASVDAVLSDLTSASQKRALPSAADRSNPVVPKQEISVRDLTYRYPGADQEALNRISLRVAAKTTVGLVGSSGAGKSTLLDLLLGLLEPSEGGIYVDEQRLDESIVSRWQATIGYVPQHIFLADQSVAANIALGEPAAEIDLEAVHKASRLANLHEFVTQDLPDSYDTIIGERGVRLSGGQRQRIGIARALYRNPSVLVFDEATSALDNETERSVMQAIRNLSGDKTIFLVAHRLSTVRDCDEIFVLHNGIVSEHGTWDELLAAGDRFKILATGAVA